MLANSSWILEMYNIDMIRHRKNSGIAATFLKMLSFFHISWFLTTLDHLFACIRCPAKGNDIQMNLLWLSMLWPGMVRLSMLQLNMARLNIPRSISSLISKCCNFLLTLQDFTTFLSLRYCGFPWKRGNVVNFPEFLNFYNILLKQVAFMRQRRYNLILGSF